MLPLGPLVRICCSHSLGMAALILLAGSCNPGCCVVTEVIELMVYQLLSVHTTATVTVGVIVTGHDGHRHSYTELESGVKVGLK